MNFLVDTHTLLWAFRFPEELSDHARSILADPSADLLVSIAVPWEMAIKSGTGKLDAANILDDFDGLMTAGGYRMLETSTKHAIQSGRLPLHHKDPFDRLLVAQSLDLGIPILSCDEFLDRYGVRRVWK
jgi:PIN domain nuclease of toxin-antitoxin system